MSPPGTARVRSGLTSVPISLETVPAGETGGERRDPLQDFKVYVTVVRQQINGQEDKNRNKNQRITKSKPRPFPPMALLVHIDRMRIAKKLGNVLRLEFVEKRVMDGCRLYDSSRKNPLNLPNYRGRRRGLPFTVLGTVNLRFPCRFLPVRFVAQRSTFENDFSISRILAVSRFKAPFCAPASWANIASYMRR